MKTYSSGWKCLHIIHYTMYIMRQRNMKVANWWDRQGKSPRSGQSPQEVDLAHISDIAAFSLRHCRSSQFSKIARLDRLGVSNVLTVTIGMSPT